MKLEEILPKLLQISEQMSLRISLHGKELEL